MTSTNLNYKNQEQEEDYFDDEIDARTSLRTSPQSLDSAACLDEVLSRFGHTKDEKLARTETALIYNKIKHDFAKRIQSISESRSYDEARDAFMKLSLIKSEFKTKAFNEMQRERDEQEIKFKKSSNDFLNNVKQNHAKEVEELREYVDRAIQQQIEDHAIQWENLEARLARIPRTATKYSKTAIELVKMEKRLIQLAQFEDAKVVRGKLNRRLPREEAKWNQEFENRLANERKILMDAQASDRARLEERLKTLRWDTLRKREKLTAISQQRLDYHEKAMRHSHLIESRLDPELSTVHPSALLVKRRGYINTSASLRGQQLEAYMRHEKGKLDPREKKMTVVFAGSLVDTHDFNNPLDGTFQIGRSR